MVFILSVYNVEISNNFLWGVLTWNFKMDNLKIFFFFINKIEKESFGDVTGRVLVTKFIQTLGLC